MFLPKILILEENDLAPLTVASIEQNCPEFSYKIIQSTGSRVGSALANTDEISLVVQSGVALFLKDGDLPLEDTLRKYHIAVSKYNVFSTHTRLCSTYEAMAETRQTKDMVDLSVFMVNPERWSTRVETDRGVLIDVKKLFMPRYMNHKTDVLLRYNCLGARDAFTYGMLGKKSAVLNYVPSILSGEANVIESYAYNFDRLLPFTGGLGKKDTDRIEYLAELTASRIRKVRDGIFDVEEDYLGGV